MLKSFRPTLFLRRDACKTLFTPAPFFRFSNTESSSIPKDKEADPAQSSQSTKNSPSSKFYFPVRRINFHNKHFAPIYTTEATRPGPSMIYRFFAAFSPFFAYGITYTFFLDITNYWHILPMAYLLFRGVKSLFSDVRYAGSRVKTIYFNKDGKTLAVVLPHSPVFAKFAEEVNLAPNPAPTEDEIVFTVDLEKVHKVGYLEKLRKGRRKIKNQDYVPLNQEQLEKEAKEFKEEMIARGELSELDTEFETRNIVIMIEKDGKSYSLYVNTDWNTSPEYNDYLHAIAKKKRIILRDTKA